MVKMSMDAFQVLAETAIRIEWRNLRQFFVDRFILDQMAVSFLEPKSQDTDEAGASAFRNVRKDDRLVSVINSICLVRWEKVDLAIARC